MTNMNMASRPNPSGPAPKLDARMIWPSVWVRTVENVVRMVVVATRSVVENVVVDVVAVVVTPETVVLVKEVNDSVFTPVVCNVVVLNDVETCVVDVVVLIEVVVKLVLDETKVDVDSVTTPTTNTPTPVSPVFPLTKTL